MKVLHFIAFALIVIGGLNWGLVGAFHFNLVMKIFGDGTVANVIYILVGLSALFEALTHNRNCKMCAGSTAPATAM